MEHPSPPSRPSYSPWVRWSLAGFFALALILPAITQARWPGVVAGLLIVVGLLALVGDSAVGAVFGVRCPGCGRWGLIPVRAEAFGHRYFRCDSCGVRVKRRPLGTWCNASRPEEEAHYRPRGNAGGWTAAPEGTDLAVGGTTGNLLANHRRRAAGETAPAAGPGVPSAD